MGNSMRLDKVPPMPGKEGEAACLRQKLEQTQADLKDYQARILQQEKLAAIGQLAAGVAHEINNPVGFITSNLHSLRKYLDKLTEYIGVQDELIGHYDNPAAQERLRAAKKALKIDFVLEDIEHLLGESIDGAQRVNRIVQGLKSFSRVSDNEVKAIDLEQCLENTLNLVWNEIKFKAKMVRDYQPLPLVPCCEQQMAQVFMNLLVNAAQAIEQQGCITLSTRYEHGWVSVAISDTGGGIAPEHLDRLFEPFFTTKEVGQGTGLGLAIVHDIIQKHGGDIKVGSTPGRGTCFTLRLPATTEGEGAHG